MEDEISATKMSSLAEAPHTISKDFYLGDFALFDLNILYESFLAAGTSLGFSLSPNHVRLDATNVKQILQVITKSRSPGQNF